MAKETFYFSHDYEPTSDIKMCAMIGQFGAVGYGLFWRIVELLHSEPTHKLPQKKYVYSAIAKQFTIDVEQVLAFVEFCLTECDLLKQDGEKMYFWSERVNRNFEKRAEISEVRSDAGKKSAEKRRLEKEANLLITNKTIITNDEQNSTNVEQVSTSVEQNLTNFNKEKKRKEKERKELNIDFDVFWNLYDKKVGDKVKLKIKWDALTDEERQKAISHITLYKKAKPDKQFRKDPQTYLNNKSFNDEIIGNILPHIEKPKEVDKREYWEIEYAHLGIKDKEEFMKLVAEGKID